MENVNGNVNYDSLSSSELYDERTAYYHIKMRKSWFRAKDVFTDRLNHYERLLVTQRSVNMELNAGNMIYIMMQRLEMGVDWEKQAALISSYRDLVFKLSYVSVVWDRKDINFIHMDGQKADIMWALAFITQVFPDLSLECQEVPSEAEIYDGVVGAKFEIQNGVYVGQDKDLARKFGELLPDIWSGDVHLDVAQVVETPQYNVQHQPVAGDRIVLPDGRVADYIRMDERFRLAEKFGTKADVMVRHNISASLIKDFYDMLWRQTSLDYDVYHMRYVALMNKVHELERMLGGLEISCYDLLPIGERGLPYASDATIERTNELDAGSLTYVIEKLDSNKTSLNNKERKCMSHETARSVVGRLAGYDMEFRSYRASGTNEGICANVRVDKCTALYDDFATVDSYDLLRFSQKVYRRLCNDPDNSVYNMTSFEKERLRLFGRGYLDFLNYKLHTVRNKYKLGIYKRAMALLKSRYLDKLHI